MKARRTVSTTATVNYMTNPTVSVVMTVFNGLRYVSRAVKRLLRQHSLLRWGLPAGGVSPAWGQPSSTNQRLIRNVTPPPTATPPSSQR